MSHSSLEVELSSRAAQPHSAKRVACRPNPTPRNCPTWAPKPEEPTAWTRRARPSLCGWTLGRSHLLAVGTGAAVNVGVQTALCVPAFGSLGGIYPQMDLPGHTVTPFLVFWNCHTVF